MTNSDTFKAAWKIATIAEFNFGGNKVDYFAEALKQAHKMTKTHSTIKRNKWNFSIIDSWLMVTLPNNESYKLQKTVINNYRHLNGFILESAKNSTFEFTAKQIETIKYLSNRKF